jgi:hypothetical protein
MTDIFRGFTEAELSEAFAKVVPADDWRKPIDTMIHPDEYAAIAAAVEFYTGTTLIVAGDDPVTRMVRVAALGYRAGPAGP